MKYKFDLGERVQSKDGLRHGAVIEFGKASAVEWYEEDGSVAGRSVEFNENLEDEPKPKPPTFDVECYTSREEFKVPTMTRAGRDLLAEQVPQYVGQFVQDYGDKFKYADLVIEVLRQ
jgi:hypothetical protein